jgi:hypothetical protein
MNTCTTMKTIGACALLALSAGIAQAVPYYCDSFVEGVLTQRGGNVLIMRFAGANWLQLCSIAVATNGVSTDQCKVVYTTLLAAQLAGQRARLWFDDGLTCATQPSWQNATGWYFGPMVLE